MLDSGQKSELESPLIEKDLSEKGKKILLYIAKHENSAQHEVKKKLEVDYQLLYYHFDQLKEKNLIREAGKKETKRGPKRKTYEPTMAGSLYAYSKDPDNPQIVKYSEKFFPLVVGKREVFREHGVEGIILDSFRDFASGWWGFGAYRLSKADSEEEVNDELTKWFFRDLFRIGSSKGFLGREIEGIQDEHIERILLAMVEDEDLRRFIHPIVAKLHEAYQNRAGVYAEIKNLIEEKMEEE